MEFLIGWSGKLLLLALTFTLLSTATEALVSRFTAAGDSSEELQKAEKAGRGRLGRRRSA